MEKSKLISFMKRLGASVVLIPVVVGCLLAGYPCIIFLAWAAAALLSWEWSEMVPSKKPAFYAVTYFAATTLTMIFDLWYLAGIAIAGGTALVLQKSKTEKHRWLLILGVPYVSIGIGSVMALYDMFGPQILLWFMLVIWSFDIGGYVFGCTIKGPKLAPKISPNKTWAGFIGGVLLSMLVSAGFFMLFGADTIIVKYAVIAGILAVLGQIGDLIESAIKRHLKLKDSSNLIPGHGGVFDRIDALIFAAPFAYAILRNMLFN